MAPLDALRKHTCEGRGAAFFFSLMMFKNAVNRFAAFVLDASGSAVVAKRAMLIEPKQRCYCLWLCACACIAQFAVADASDMCTEMSATQAKDAGLTTNGCGGDDAASNVTGFDDRRIGDDDMSEMVFDWIAVWLLLAALLLVLLFLGEYEYAFIILILHIPYIHAICCA